MSSSLPMVSILIPMYNAESTICETIESCLSQTYKNCEIIIVDDGSSDKSYEIAKQFESSKCKVVHQKNAGACRARNHAFELCQGEYIQYFDADDILSLNKIECQMEALSRWNGKNTLAICNWQKFRQKPGDLTWEKHVFPLEGNGMSFVKRLLAKEFISLGQCYLTPRGLIEQAGNWDERLKVNQDGEFFIRVLLHAERVIYCPDTMVHYRWGNAGSISQSNLWKKQDSALLALQCIAENVLACEDSLEVRRLLSVTFSAFAYKTCVKVPQISAAALAEIQKLGVKGNLTRPPKMAALSHIIGLRSALKIKRFFAQIAPGQKGK